MYSLPSKIRPFDMDSANLFLKPCDSPMSKKLNQLKIEVIAINIPYSDAPNDPYKKGI